MVKLCSIPTVRIISWILFKCPLWTLIAFALVTVLLWELYLGPIEEDDDDEDDDEDEEPLELAIYFRYLAFHQNIKKID